MRRWVLAIIAVNLIGLVVLAFVYPHLMVSPGPLISAHADLTTDCFACHAPLRGTPSDRCTACHGTADIGLRTTKGVPIGQQTLKASFHQELIEQNCTACHSDHPGPMLARSSSTTFSHALLRAPTRDRCADCHKVPVDTLHRQISGNCGQCHGQEGWKPATFDHNKFFVLDGDHQASCTTCHSNNNYSNYTCYGCHEHQPGGIQAEHREENITDLDNCVKCHRSAQEEGDD